MLQALSALAAEDVYVHHGPPWWPIFPILWFLVILAIVVAVTRRRCWGGCGYGHGPSGLGRLAERYAAGEIDETEYRNRRAVLEEQFKRGR
jgi:putative membrane protein